MNQTNFLKMAYLHGVAKAAGEAGISKEDIDILAKQAFSLNPAKAWGKLKGLVGKGAKGVEELHPWKTPKMRSLEVPKLPKAPPKAPVSAGPGGTVAKKIPKAPPKAPAPAAAGAKAEESVAQQYEKARAKMPQETAKQLGEAEQAGTRGSLGFIPSTALPVAAGAGLGYAADGREGALVGGGLALGARAGMSPVLKRLREARGLGKMLGRSAGAAPTMREYLGTPMGRKSLWGAGIAGAAGAGLGYAAGRVLPKKEPKNWYSGLGLGLTPEALQSVSQTALPFIASKYNVDPIALQNLGAEYGLTPPQMAAVLQSQAQPEMSSEQPDMQPEMQYETY